MRERKPGLSSNGKVDEVAGMMSRQLLETVAVVLSWFVLNIAMASSTKWLFLYGQICEGVANSNSAAVMAAAAAVAVADTSADPKVTCRSFKFPLTITIVHMVFSWMMCYVHIFVFRGGLKGGMMSLRNQVEKIAPLAGCFALSVAMGNLSLKYIFPSFNQMLGAMSPLITVLMAVVIQSKRYNAWTWASMPIICGGLALCSAKEVNFNYMGAFFATGATILRAAKSIMQGKLLTDSNKLDSVTLLFYMAPWAAMLLLTLSAASEGMEPVHLLLGGLRYATGVPNVLFLLVVSGLNACLLNVSNFLVTSYTSPVTLQVLGNVKSCMSIGVSVLIFRNEMSWEQAIGVLICLFGVWLYNKKGGTVKPPKALNGSSFTELSSAKPKDAVAGTATEERAESDEKPSQQTAPADARSAQIHKSTVAAV